jgi:hypothetical protein
MTQNTRICANKNVNGIFNQIKFAFFASFAFQKTFGIASTTMTFGNADDADNADFHGKQ